MYNIFMYNICYNTVLHPSHCLLLAPHRPGSALAWPTPSQYTGTPSTRRIRAQLNSSCRHGGLSRLSWLSSPQRRVHRGWGWRWWERVYGRWIRRRKLRSISRPSSWGKIQPTYPNTPSLLLCTSYHQLPPPPPCSLRWWRERCICNGRERCICDGRRIWRRGGQRCYSKEPNPGQQSLYMEDMQPQAGTTWKTRWRKKKRWIQVQG